jgi:hypothetical protein
MKRPICSLCARVGNVCTFPVSRKRPANRIPNERPEKRHHSNVEPSTDALASPDFGLDQSTELLFDVPQLSEISTNDAPAVSAFYLENTDFGNMAAHPPWSSSPFDFLQSLSDFNCFDVAMSTSSMPATPCPDGIQPYQSDNGCVHPWRIICACQRHLYLLKRSPHETGESSQMDDNEQIEKNDTLTVTASTALSLYLPLHIYLEHSY